MKKHGPKSIAMKLKAKGVEVNIELVDRASFLHDLDKAKTVETGNHSKIAFESIKGKYPEVAEVIRNHNFGNILDGLNTWEDKIVNYADKRSTEDNIVTLEQRFEYGRKRYSHKNEDDRGKAEELFRALEKEIFEHLDFAPDELKQVMENA